VSRTGDAVTSERTFVAEPVEVYAFVGRFFAALAAGGVEHVVVSPGSRSTPLAIAASRTPGLRLWLEIDERSAGYFALGCAKASRRPAALICTSGTAAANYLPAIVEAHYARVPLLALTADRPPELRDWGAGQTIEQTGLYGRYPRWSVEVPLPGGGADAERYAARLAARSIEQAAGRPAGPVHLNWPLREPLAPPTTPDASPAVPASSGPVTAEPALRFSRACERPNAEDVDELVARVRAHERGVICAGPADADGEWVDAVVAFARAAGWPVLADPTSQLRSAEGDAAILSLGDALLRAPGFAQRMRPEIVLRLGETPVSKAQRQWIESVEPEALWWLDEGSHWGEPSHRATRVVRGEASALLAAAAEALAGHEARSSDWCRAFESAEERARGVLVDFVAEEEALCGLAAAVVVSESLPAGAQLFASNSMAIRLLDLGFGRRRDPVRVLCSRGASGIDGITSTALGIAAASPEGRRSVLLTGDLAFLHDLGGLLMARHEPLDLVIVVLDDDGGGIFSFLPVAEQGEAVGFERLFRTPHGLDLARAAALFELAYARVETREALAAALDQALERGGVSILHVPLDAARSQTRFREALARIATAVDAPSGEARR
jgi:2-succinyl-5-enolpyruvyl-6-hydroxy-3-cyclohexene-1-carboxylate synthase